MLLVIFSGKKMDYFYFLCSTFNVSQIVHILLVLTIFYYKSHAHPFLAF